ncbi:hypothetical protein ABL78_4351 [Leptomonas seymouri]|uniref:Uncharacterized protein n=1 Tax=Leptomonas seymouri TaxID=5684 RepID=A0A0N0P5K5_LEPSE|nr:hypothetical protein ABL78_4351 [Leptomonas seymouri]|eukprot:KPI86576.1 hypothetical protein ABL78_4351 [Leptomonas seymouri]
MSTDFSGRLIRFDTSALESHLNGLTDQWEGQVRGLCSKMENCSSVVRGVSADVSAIQRFLLYYHKREMSAALSATAETLKGSDFAEGSIEAPTDPLEECATLSPDDTSTKNLLKMVTIARRLLADNEALRDCLANATGALSAYNASHESLRQEVAQLRELTTAQSERLQNVSEWLGMSGLPLTSDADDDGEGGTSKKSGGAELLSAEALSKSTEAVLSRSPLLLAFRRFLLRDLTARLTSVVDQQSKDFHHSVAHLEERIQSGQCVVMGGDSQQDGDSSDLLETVRTLSKRVNALDQRAVKRDEFTSLMRSKADSLLLPVKADSAAVSEMERRLATRCADLEERCAYADAERTEFRAILRSLIAARSTSGGASHPSRCGSQTPVMPSSAAGASLPLSAPDRGAVLRDLLPSVSGASVAAPGSSLGRQKSQPLNASHEVPSLTSSTSPHSASKQQLFRVVGRSQGIGVLGMSTPRIHSAAASEEAAAPAATMSSAGSVSAHAQSAPPKGNGEKTVAIGMTPSQGEYASYVSQQLNRKQVQALPALPYERL